MISALQEVGATTVLDLGCGEGNLLRELLREPAFRSIAGMDVSHRSLETAHARLRLDTLPAAQRERVTLLHGSLTYQDRRLAGYDAAVAMEVIEHIDPPRLEAFEAVVFGAAQPGALIITTPNSEYNALFADLPPDQFRHRDHRFEWTRPEFQDWAPSGRRPPGIRSTFPRHRATTLHPRRADTDGGVHPMNLEIPELCLVVLVGPSGSGKSTFAARHFKSTEVVSSDACRAMVADDANDQAATPDAFALLNYIASTRLRAGRLTVIDATSVQPQARKSLVELAREHDCLPVAIVLNMPESVCLARNRDRDDRNFGDHVVRRQVQQLRRSIRGLRREGFRYIYVLDTPEDVDAATMERTPSWTNRQHETGPFDIIGDVHGCFDELVALLERLDYRIEPTGVGGSGGAGFSVSHPQGRKAVFVGDLVDRGPGVANVLRLVMSMVADGTALCVAGNHESKLVRKLKGRNVQVSHGLAESLAQLELEPPEFQQQATRFMDRLISHYVLDGGNLVVVHAGMKEEYQGRASARVRDFCLYGETTGRDGRMGPARPRRLGRRLSRTSHRRLRPHPGGGTNVVEPHHQRRYRLRLWRTAHRAALPRKRVGVGRGDAGILRAGATHERRRSGRGSGCRDERPGRQPAGH